MPRQPGGLGNMPLTLFVIVAGVVLYLYVRRANMGIDLAPHEAASSGVPVLPQVPGTPGPPTVTIPAATAPIVMPPFQTPPLQMPNGQSPVTGVIR